MLLRAPSFNFFINKEIFRPVRLKKNTVHERFFVALLQKRSVNEKERKKTAK